VIALKIPNDPHWPQMVFATKVQNLLFALGRCSIGVPFGNGGRIDQACFSTFCVGFAPALETGTTDPEITAGFSDMLDLFSVSTYPQLALNLPFVIDHEHLLDPKFGRLKEMSRE
jgi:hypothetical protein